MTEPATLPENVHPEAALLPWFINGTLGESERRKVASHLETCEACRVELMGISNLKTELSAIYATQPGPLSNRAPSIFRAVAREASAHRKVPTSQGSWLEHIDQWLRSLFLPRWVPTLAVTIFLAQVGLLLWSTMPALHPGQVITRSLGPPSIRFFVAFQGTASEEQIRAILKTVRGRIVDGPDLNGLYTVEVLAGDAETNRKKLDLLREHTDVVRSVNSEKP